MNRPATNARQLRTNRRGCGRLRVVPRRIVGWRSRVSVVVASMVIVGTSGCQPTGTWKLTETDPPSAAFPLQELTLYPSGQFAATSTAFGERIPSQGAYRWKWGTLEVGRSGFEPRSYTIKHRWGGGLVFIHKEDGRRVSAYFERVDPNDVSVSNDAGEASGPPETDSDSRAAPEPPNR